MREIRATGRVPAAWLEGDIANRFPHLRLVKISNPQHRFEKRKRNDRFDQVLFLIGFILDELVVHVVDPCRALALAGQQEASMAEKALHSEPQFDQRAPEGRAGKGWRAIKRQQREGGDQPEEDLRLEFVHVTRHFTDDYAPIDLKIAFTEAEQRLSKRGDKRPIDVPIEPCQPNENVLQHCLSRLSPACTGRTRRVWSLGAPIQFQWIAAQVYRKQLRSRAGKLFVSRFSMRSQSQGCLWHARCVFTNLRFSRGMAPCHQNRALCYWIVVGAPVKFQARLRLQRVCLQISDHAFIKSNPRWRKRR